MDNSPPPKLNDLAAFARGLDCCLTSSRRCGGRYMVEYGKRVTILPSGALYKFSGNASLCSFHGNLASVRDRLLWVARKDEDKLDDPPPVVYYR